MLNNTGPALPVRPELNIASFLDLESVANLLDASLDGVVVVDENRRYLYANPAACQVLGYSVEKLVGRDFLASFPEREHEGMLSHFEDSLKGRPGFWHSTVLRPDGTERDIEYSNMLLFVRDRPCGAAIFRDITDTHRLEREGEAFSRIASSVAYGGSLEATLDTLCRHVVEATGTVAAAVALGAGDDDKVKIVGCYGHPDEYVHAINELFDNGLEAPTREAFVERRTAITRDARQVLMSEPMCEPVHDFMRTAEWDTVVAVPMVFGSKSVGVLIGYYPESRDPDRAEIVFLEAIANQAAVAVENARLLAGVQDRAAVEERSRLARELHDSVTQALFSINLTARSAEVALEREGNPDLVKQKLRDLRQLTQGAMAEMRALIFELRPGALEEEGLVQALKKHAAAVQGRDLLQIEVAVEGGAEFPRLEPALEEALYRIAQEAVHNIVKHAHATTASITLGIEGEYMVLKIEDNGQGFDTNDVPPGHMGLGNIRQRARGFAGECNIESSPGQGTTVTVRVPAG